MPARGRLTILAALLAGVGLAGCGSGGEDQAAVAPATTAPTTTQTTASEPPASADPSPTTAPAGPVAVPEFLDFVAPDVRGGQVTGAELAGQDLVIWFWAPW